MKSTTTSVNISMPASLKKLMQKRMAQGGFENASEYIRHLIRNDEDATRAARDTPSATQAVSSLKDLQNALKAGERSGPGKQVDEKFWQDLRKRAISGTSRVRSSRKSA